MSYGYNSALLMVQLQNKFEAHNYGNMNQMTDKMSKLNTDLSVIAKALQLIQAKKKDGELDLRDPTVKATIDGLREVMPEIIDEMMKGTPDKFDKNRLEGFMDSLNREPERLYPLLNQVMGRLSQRMQEGNQISDITAEILRACMKEEIMTYIHATPSR